MFFCMQATRVVTEKYWALLELMRQEFLADIAEYYDCIAPNIQANMQQAYSGKLAKMKHVIQASVGKPLPGPGMHDSTCWKAAAMSGRSHWDEWWVPHSTSWPVWGGCRAGSAVLRHGKMQSIEVCLDGPNLAVPTLLH